MEERKNEAAPTHETVFRGALRNVEPSRSAGKQPTAWGTYRHWQHQRRNGVACSHCGGPQDRDGQRYCKACHADFMRVWRRSNRLTGEAKKRQAARGYARVYLTRGKIKRLPCEICGSQESQMHHEDYDRPLEVRWLCRPCHLAIHRGEAQLSTEAPVVVVESEVVTIFGVRVPKNTPRAVGLCARCRGPNDRNGQSYCRSCHAEYAKRWRKAQKRQGRA